MRLTFWKLIVPMVVLPFLLSSCLFSSDSQQAREAADKFWTAVLADDMETAKQLVTWESVQYLHYLKNDRVSAQRFETGEMKINETIAEIATVLYGGERGDMEIPLRTVLIKYDDAWLVDVQKTMGSMVSGAMGAVVDQLNSFMQDGLKGLDEALSDSIDQFGKTLNEGMRDLEKELESSPTIPPKKPEGQAI